jgi:hypothetical protein
MKTIEPLSLGQDQINLDSGESSCRWYGWSTRSGVTWDRRPAGSPAGRGPDYACDVTFPAVMAGTPEEIRSDIAAALRRHATALGLD